MPRSGPLHARWGGPSPELPAELDAAFFALYGISREDVEYILGTFAGLRSEESVLPGFRSTTAWILEAHDRLSR